MDGSLGKRSMITQGRRLMLVLMIGVFLSPLNVTFTGIALPTMRTDLGVNIEQATWVGTAYFIPAVALMPMQAYLGEQWGARRVYGLGLLILAVGALLSAAAPSFQWLLASRVLQGIGWAALYPLALVLIRRHYPAARQGEMMGLWESSVGFATIIGPLLGGAMIVLLGWQSLYLVLGAVAGLGALLTPMAIPSGDGRRGTERTAFDWSGALHLTLALTLILAAITFRSPLLLVVGLLAGWLWQRLARRKAAPVIDPDLLSNRRFLGAATAAHLRMLVAVATLMALPLFFEDVQGLGPALVGTLMVIYSIFLFLAAWPGGRWADQADAYVPGLVGYIAMAVGVLLLLAFDAALSVALVALALAVRGIGAGLTQTPYAKMAVEAVSREQARMAVGLYGTIRYSGLALGTALVGILLQARLVHYDALAGGAQALPAYRELWLVLAALTLTGVLLTWSLRPRTSDQSPVTLDQYRT